MGEFVEIVFSEQEQEGTEAAVERWLKNLGEVVYLHEPLVEINTDKVSIELPAPAEGVLVEILKEEGASIEPGDLLGRIERRPCSSPSPAESAASPAGSSQAGSPGGNRAGRRLSPAVRRLLEQHSLSPEQIPGSGRGGRLTKKDVLHFLAAEAPGPSPGRPAPPSRRLPHSPMRRRIARHMLESVQTAPQAVSIFEVDFSALKKHRLLHRKQWQDRGVPLTYTAYIIAAAAEALQAVPEVNSRWHETELEVFAHCHIGVATALGSGGLVVPVLRHVQDLDLEAIARGLAELTEKARQRKLQRRDLEGATFSISNYGVSGSLIATPIIPQPQAAILGVGRIEPRIRVVSADGEPAIGIREMAYLTLTIDHRALDGDTANRFLTHLARAIQQWPEES